MLLYTQLQNNSHVLDCFVQSSVGGLVWRACLQLVCSVYSFNTQAGCRMSTLTIAQDLLIAERRRKWKQLNDANFPVYTKEGNSMDISGGQGCLQKDLSYKPQMGQDPFHSLRKMLVFEPILLLSKNWWALHWSWPLLPAFFRPVTSGEALMTEVQWVLQNLTLEPSISMCNKNLMKVIFSLNFQCPETVLLAWGWHQSFHSEAACQHGVRSS